MYKFKGYMASHEIRSLMNIFFFHVHFCLLQYLQCIMCILYIYSDFLVIFSESIFLNRKICLFSAFFYTLRNNFRHFFARATRTVEDMRVLTF